MIKPPSPITENVHKWLDKSREGYNQGKSIEHINGRYFNMFYSDDDIDEDYIMRDLDKNYDKNQLSNNHHHQIYHFKNKINIVSIELNTMRYEINKLFRIFIMISLNNIYKFKDDEDEINKVLFDASMKEVFYKFCHKNTT